VIPAIQKSGNGRVLVLASEHPANAAQIAERFEIPRIEQGYHSVLEDPDVDAVYIPLPNHLHCTWAVKALSAGKHVLCEKPLACNARQAEEMAVTARRCNRLLMEGFMYRFHPRSMAVKSAVESGCIGVPVWVRSAFCFKMDERLRQDPENVRVDPSKGGGALLDVGCYGVSVARWLIGSEPIRVQAQAIFDSRGVDLHVVGTLRFPDTTLAIVEASFISALQQTYCVVGTEGAIDLPHNAFIPWQNEACYTLRGHDDETGRVVCTPGADEYLNMVTHFADAVLGKATLAYGPRDSVYNMAVLDALADAARAGCTVKVDHADLAQGPDR
jgi:predicted dehydrogenase